MDFHLLEGTVLANAFAWMRVRYVLDLMSLGARSGVPPSWVRN